MKKLMLCFAVLFCLIPVTYASASSIDFKTAPSDLDPKENYGIVHETPETRMGEETIVVNASYKCERYYEIPKTFKLNNTSLQVGAKSSAGTSYKIAVATYDSSIGWGYTGANTQTYSSASTTQTKYYNNLKKNTNYRLVIEGKANGSLTAKDFGPN